MASTVLIIGATKGLGQCLAEKYVAAGATVYGTARGEPDNKIDSSIKWITGIDLLEESASEKITSQLDSSVKFDLVIISAGYFHLESFDKPSFSEEVAMYKISSISPVLIVQRLFKASHLPKGSKVILVSSESGSIALRHEKEGGGAYGHHASKAALNMVGKLLSLDLKDSHVAVGLVHPGFMRTGMTRGVGFDQFWDEGGAVTPEESANSLVEFIDKFDMSMTGQYWAPRGAADIGTAEPVLGPKKDLPVPLQLPW